MPEREREREREREQVYGVKDAVIVSALTFSLRGAIEVDKVPETKGNVPWVLRGGHEKPTIQIMDDPNTSCKDVTKKVLELNKDYKSLENKYIDFEVISSGFTRDYGTLWVTKAINISVKTRSYFPNQLVATYSARGEGRLKTVAKLLENGSVTGDTRDKNSKPWKLRLLGDERNRGQIIKIRNGLPDVYKIYTANEQDGTKLSVINLKTIPEQRGDGDPYGQGEKKQDILEPGWKGRVLENLGFVLVLETLWDFRETYCIDIETAPFTDSPLKELMLKSLGACLPCLVVIHS